MDDQGVAARLAIDTCTVAVITERKHGYVCETMRTVERCELIPVPCQLSKPGRFLSGQCGESFFPIPVSGTGGEFEGASPVVLRANQTVEFSRNIPSCMPSPERPISHTSFCSPIFQDTFPTCVPQTPSHLALRSAIQSAQSTNCQVHTHASSLPWARKAVHFPIRHVYHIVGLCF